MPLSLPLQGVRVHLSGSVPDKATSEEREGIEAFVQKLASAVLRDGGTLVHGSHPTLVKPLEAAALPFLAAGQSRDRLVLARSHRYALTKEHLEEIERQEAFSAVQIIPAVPGNVNESLVPMREWMAERSDVVVAVGGKWEDIPSRAGAPLELEEALSRGKPGFAVGGFGGAIAAYLNAEASVLSRLHNGLTPDNNRRLAKITDPVQLTGEIIAQLRLLPLVRKSVATGRLFRILALDGGGIRGTFTAAVLARWMENLGEKSGRDLIKHFDLVVGTSTGAILAIGLGLGLTPLEMLEFYRKNGQKIFPSGGKGRHFVKSKHESVALGKVLKDVFGERTLSKHSCCRLVIPVVRGEDGKPETIVTAHNPNRVRFREITAVDAALATSAAPTYFDPAKIVDAITEQTYLDGGIWANNPVLPAIAEAVGHLQIPIERIDVLSIGTLESETDFSKQHGSGKLQWAPTISDLFFAAQEGAAATMADCLLSKARHLRVNESTPTAIPLDDTKAIAEMARRGSNKGDETYADVRSRFLDGFHVRDWRLEEKQT